MTKKPKLLKLIFSNGEKLSTINEPPKCHMISDTHGFLVENNGGVFFVIFVKKEVSGGKTKFVKLGIARSRGRLHVYPSPFLADYAVRKEILPLYAKGDLHGKN